MDTKLNGQINRRTMFSHVFRRDIKNTVLPLWHGSFEVKYASTGPENNFIWVIWQKYQIYECESKVKYEKENPSLPPFLPIRQFNVLRSLNLGKSSGSHQCVTRECQASRQVNPSVRVKQCWGLPGQVWTEEEQVLSEKCTLQIRRHWWTLIVVSEMCTDGRLEMSSFIEWHAE